jgi:hypothetical protein
MQNVPLKLRYLPATLHGVTSQKTKPNINWHEDLKPQEADVYNGINDTSSYSNMGNFYSRINLFSISKDATSDTTCPIISKGC